LDIRDKAIVNEVATGRRWLVGWDVAHAVTRLLIEMDDLKLTTLQAQGDRKFAMSASLKLQSELAEAVQANATLKEQLSKSEDGNRTMQEEMNGLLETAASMDAAYTALQRSYDEVAARLNKADERRRAEMTEANEDSRAATLERDRAEEARRAAVLRAEKEATAAIALQGEVNKLKQERDDLAHRLAAQIKATASQASLAVRHEDYLQRILNLALQAGGDPQPRQEPDTEDFDFVNGEVGVETLVKEQWA
jgi:hypothetical protein